MGSTIDCTWEQYKQAQKEFHDALPTLNEEESDNAFKCLTLYYFGMNENRWQHSCLAAYQIASREFTEHMAKLGSSAILSIGN